MLTKIIQHASSIRFLRFLAVGGLNTAFGYGLFALLFYIGLHYSLAVLLSTLAGILFNFFTTGKIVFRNSDTRLLTKFFLVYGLVYLANIFFLRIFEAYKLNLYLGGAILILPMAVFSYILQKSFVFTDKGTAIPSKRRLQFILFWIPLCSTLSLLFLHFVTQIFSLDLKKPILYDGDFLTSFLVIKALANGNWFPFGSIQTSLASAPYGFHMNDFPIPQLVIFLGIKGLSVFDPNPFFLYNLYYILSFPATAVLFMAVLYRFRIHPAIGGIVGLLYSFLPFHFLRFGHWTALDYTYLPLSLLILLPLSGKNPPFYNLLTRRDIRNPKIFKLPLFYITICTILALTGAYYVFFFLSFVCILGIASSIRKKNPANAVSALMITAFVLMVFLLALLPNFLYYKDQSRSQLVGVREVRQAEFYSLKATSLFLPQSEHRIKLFRELKSSYTPLLEPTEGHEESAGLIAGVFLLFLFFRLFGGFEQGGVQKTFSILAGFGLLLGIGGGFGVLFNIIVSPEIRCYNRISIFLCLFAFASLAFFLQNTKKHRNPWFTGGIAFLLLLFGIWEQTSPSYILPRTQNVESDSDRDYVEKAESVLKQGSMVYQLPFQDFPEPGPVHKMNQYEHFKLPIHSKTLSWSYGSFRGSRENNIHRELAEDMNLDKIYAMGYSAISVNKAGYADSGSELNKLFLSLGMKKVADSLNGNHILYIFPDSFHREREKQITNEKKYFQNRIEVAFRGGFYEKMNLHRNEFRVLAKKSGTVVLWNNQDSVRSAKLSFEAASFRQGEFHLILAGIDKTIILPIGQTSNQHEIVYNLKPGMNRLDFLSNIKPVRDGKGDREISFLLDKFTIVPIPDGDSF